MELKFETNVLRESLADSNICPSHGLSSAIVTLRASYANVLEKGKSCYLCCPDHVASSTLDSTPQCPRGASFGDDLGKSSRHDDTVTIRKNIHSVRHTRIR